jgi:penicillin-binding protein 1A
MEPAHAGLSNLPLPGDNNPYNDGTGAVASYSENYQGDDAYSEEYLPRERKRRGFFESLFGSSDDEDEGDGGYEAPRRRQSDRGDGSSANKLRERGNSK